MTDSNGDLRQLSLGSLKPVKKVHGIGPRAYDCLWGKGRGSIEFAIRPLLYQVQNSASGCSQHLMLQKKVKTPSNALGLWDKSVPGGGNAILRPGMISLKQA